MSNLRDKSSALQWRAAKDPQDIKDYQIDWSARLEGSEEIASIEWTVPTPLDAIKQSSTTNSATIWLGGGIAGELYDVRCKATTNEGRVFNQTVQLRCLTL